ncbi:hypothetical protein [Zunongwangia profunda]|uniref:hypothetical protein n=1 Tax=Zunongwangia profunda TaxID=398743 RepID=UPI00248D799C|nr:hypothetical protein [Zunongwangia profunda]|tara:strand:+ start:4932 stop:5570 length:639 start_codon:yes stop_codon:yes gene_type:complete
MKRPLNIRTAYSKEFDTYPFTGIWKDVFGNATKNGVWIVYGAEKNGKSWLSLKLSDMLSQFGSGLYISAEEGLEKEFIDAMKRARLEPGNESLKFVEYTPLEEISERLEKRNPPKFVVFDNVTVYKDELSYGAFQKFWRRHPNTHFIFIAHEERNEPYTATAKMIKRLSKIIIRVQGLACFVSGRCPGGSLTIDEEKAQLYHGAEIKNNQDE